MKYSIGRVDLYPSFIALLSASAYFGSLELLAALLLAAAFHEFGHIAAAWCTGRHLDRLTLTALGAELTLEEEYVSGSFFQDLILSLSGPAANLLLAAVLTASHQSPLLIGANLLLGFFNLLPVAPLDGGCALFSLLSWLTSLEWADRLTSCISKGFSLGIILWGIALLLLPGGKPWLLLMGFWLASASFHFTRDKAAVLL